MFGRPVVASAIAALKERIATGVNGFTFPARDSRALADLMASLIGNERQWMKVNETIEQPWSERDMFDAYLSVWEELGETQKAESDRLNAAAQPSAKVEAPRSAQKAERKKEKRHVAAPS